MKHVPRGAPGVRRRLFEAALGHVTHADAAGASTSGASRVPGVSLAPSAQQACISSKPIDAKLINGAASSSPYQKNTRPLASRTPGNAIRRP